HHPAVPDGSCGADGARRSDRYGVRLGSLEDLAGALPRSPDGGAAVGGRARRGRERRDRLVLRDLARKEGSETGSGGSAAVRIIGRTYGTDCRADVLFQRSRTRFAGRTVLAVAFHLHVLRIHSIPNAAQELAGR